MTTIPRQKHFHEDIPVDVSAGQEGVVVLPTYWVGPIAEDMSGRLKSALQAATTRRPSVLTKPTPCYKHLKLGNP